MRSVVLEAPGRLAAAERAAPSGPREGHAIVRVRRVGVCGTDFHAWRGRQPFFTFPRVLGHELAVEVVSLAAAERQSNASGSGLAAGQACAVEPYLNCGSCAACRAGRGNCCERLRVLGVHVDGGMCELLEVPIDKLHPSSTLGLDALALVETVSVGAHAVARAGTVAGRRLLVVGAGPIGLSVATVAHAQGATVMVLDVSEHRLEFCRTQLGIPQTLRPADDVPAQVRAAWDGALPDIVIDATGHAGSMERSFQLPAHGGTLVFVGLVQGTLTFDDPEFHRRELTVLASRNALPSDFARVIALAESGAVDLTRWISHRAKLEDVPAVLPAWADPATRVLKAEIEI